MKLEQLGENLLHLQRIGITKNRSVCFDWKEAPGNEDGKKDDYVITDIVIKAPGLDSDRHFTKIARALDFLEDL